MTRRVDDRHRPEIAPTAGDLGEEAYLANLYDEEGVDEVDPLALRTGTTPAWKRPRVKNRHREDEKVGPVLKIGSDPDKPERSAPKR